jgi:FlaA1/EpsC-like NDP-sugar epimerase
MMLSQLPKNVRLGMILVGHVALFALGYAAAFGLRFDFTVPPLYQDMFLGTLGAVLLVKVAVFWASGQFAGWWRYVGLRDLLAMARTAALGTLVCLVVVYLVMGVKGFPRSVYLLDFISTVALLGAARVGARLLREFLANRGLERDTSPLKRLLIVGAGDTGEMLLREIDKNRNLTYQAVALLDDDGRKHGLRIHGVPVLGPVSDARGVCERLRVDEIIIAAPSATRQELRAILEKIQATGIKPKILPAVESVLHGKVSLGEVREVAIEDLLGRKEVQLDGHAIAAYVRGKTVLVTGAGGSIGSEICRQVCRFEPKRLILLEQAENPLFFIEGELRRECKGVELVPVVADVCDEVRIDQVFAQHRPDVVLHAAAHKHVPLMEANPGEAVRNNVLGTRNVARSADKHKAAGFVMISTDKAINPTSVMGTTKRLAELYVQAMAAHSATQFISVRFGNVLGSNGSVVPIFREQIRKGGPVTVTHPEMTRYFMTIPEATQLVLQAASTGESGQVFVLDMGEPVRIVDLARDMIRLSGFTPGEDIEIVFSGMRPGEKLFEELSLGSEGISKTKHEKIFIGDVARLPLEVLEREVPRLRGLVEAGEPVAIKAQLKALVPEYAFAPPAPPEEEVEGKVIPFPGA